MGILEGDTTEKCDSCRTEYQKVWQDRRNLFDALLRAVESLCNNCETDFGTCKEYCTEVEEYKQIISENKKFFKGLYD